MLWFVGETVGAELRFECGFRRENTEKRAKAVSWRREEDGGGGAPWDQRIRLQRWVNLHQDKVPFLVWRELSCAKMHRKCTDQGHFHNQPFFFISFLANTRTWLFIINTVTLKTVQAHYRILKGMPIIYIFSFRSNYNSYGKTTERQFLDKNRRFRMSRMSRKTIWGCTLRRPINQNLRMERHRGWASHV